MRDRAWKGGEETQEKELWGADYSLRKHNFDQILNDKTAMLKWLEDLVVFGLTIVESSPKTTAGLETLQKKVGTVKTTLFGQYWTVQSKPNAIDLAYTSATLGMHLDNPFYAYTAGIQFLQCIKQYQGDGGINEFADAFAVAEKMKNEYPEEFEILTETKVHFWNAGSLEADEDTKQAGIFHKRHSAPTFQLDREGRVVQVSFNNQVTIGTTVKYVTNI